MMLYQKLSVYISAITVLSGQLNAVDSIFQPTGANFLVAQTSGQISYISHSKLTNRALLKNFQSLASAKRINQAGDDPAGMALAEKMKALVAELRQRSMNLSMLEDYYKLTEAAIARNYQLVRHIRDLLMRGTSPMLAPADKEYIQTEIEQFLKQIDMNATFEQFNTKQVIPELSAAGLNIEKTDVRRSLYVSLKNIDTALELLQRRRARAGIRANLLKMRIDGEDLYFVNATASLSRTMDQNMIEGISQLMLNNSKHQFQLGTILYNKK